MTQYVIVHINKRLHYINHYQPEYLWTNELSKAFLFDSEYSASEWYHDSIRYSGKYFHLIQILTIDEAKILEIIQS